MKQTGNTLLITGGGSGIGRELAYRWHDCGNTVIIAGRRASTLQQACAGRSHMHAMVFDAADQAGIERFAQKVIKDFPALNVLVNNAGIMKHESLDRHRDLTDAETTITTNLLGPIRLTNAFIDHLLKQSDPTIINVTSGLAFVPLIATPTYNATKAALHSYSISLRAALANKAQVIEIVPPGVQTELTPGQSNKPGYVPLNEYIDDVMDLLNKHPECNEILVKNVQFLRYAESSGEFDEIMKKLNSFSSKNDQ